MTVSSVVVRAVAGWTGAETEFPTGIQVLAKTQLVVSLVPDEGARLPLTLGLHYAVNLSPAGVATVVPLPAFPAVHGEVSFVRRTPMTQDYDPMATDTYDAAGHAAALDRSAMRVAELSQAVDDIAASSVVVAGGAASVPAGAVYVSDGAGKALAGPSVDEISQAEGWAGDAKQSAKAAADSAAAAALFDPSSYSTTAQITTMLAGYVLTTRTIASGNGILINGGASATLAGTITVSPDFATQSEAIAGTATGKVMSPLRVAQAIAANSKGYAHVFTAVASGSWTVPDGVTEILVALWGGGGGGGAYAVAAYGGGTGGGGGFVLHTVAVTPGQSIPFSIGAGGAGSTTYQTPGGSGGNSAVPSLGLVAPGGVGGQGGTSSSTGVNGAHGAGAGGNIVNSMVNAGIPRTVVLNSYGAWVSYLAAASAAALINNGTTYVAPNSSAGNTAARIPDMSSAGILTPGAQGGAAYNFNTSLTAPVAGGGAGGAIMIVY